MLDLDRRPPERVPTVLAPGLTGTTFSTKLPAELISTKLPVEDRPAPARSAADRAGLVDCLVAVIKLSLTFDPTSRRAAIPKAEADHLNGESFQGDDPEGIALYGGDLSPYKRLVDVTLGLPSQLRPEKQRALVVGAMRREVRGAGVLPFAALHPFQAPRNEQMGTYDEAWLRDRWPYFPKDFNFDYYNAAPIQQRLERLNGDEEVGLEGFFDDSVRTRLPGITTRAFAQCSVAFGYRFVELALRLDTLHIDLATNSIQLVWRGQFPISNALAPELSQLYACAD
ncbi:MAG: DUF2169 domain-containing protein, partial [Myxococcales bacterium]|nr:DUF2169 domain-containing protein [Myxococcales bacterium]